MNTFSLKMFPSKVCKFESISGTIELLISHIIDKNHFSINLKKLLLARSSLPEGFYMNP